MAKKKAINNPDVVPDATSSVVSSTTENTKEGGSICTLKARRTYCKELVDGTKNEYRILEAEDGSLVGRGMWFIYGGYIYSVDEQVNVFRVRNYKSLTIEERAYHRYSVQKIADEGDSFGAGNEYLQLKDNKAFISKYRTETGRVRKIGGEAVFKNTVLIHGDVRFIIGDLLQTESTVDKSNTVKVTEYYSVTVFGGKYTPGTNIRRKSAKAKAKADAKADMGSDVAPF